MKKCTQCKVQKDMKEFRVVISNVDGHNAICRECEREIQKRYQAKKKEGTIQAF